MGRLIYTAICSIDGYIEDQGGSFDWSMPDVEVHTFVNDLERATEVSLYGRRLYETMAVWETITADSGADPAEVEYAEIWRAGEKIVYSTTLSGPTTARTRIERRFVAEDVERIKSQTEGALAIGGANLAAQAFKAGLIDEVRLFLSPISVGGGKPALPRDAVVELDLIEERRFGNGVMYLRYNVRGDRNYAMSDGT